MGGDEIEIPIYLITGFLESGKTTFINFTVAQDYFQIDEPTLLITTEEGEVEYDEKELLKYNTVLEVVESQEQFTPEYLKKLKRRYNPERVILEYNPLWSVKKLEEMEMPRGWGIVQEIVGKLAPGIFSYVSGERRGFPLKPDPSLLLEGLAAAGSSVSEAVYVGDSEVDAETGRRAGIRTVIVSYGFRSEDELAASGIKSMAGSAYKLDEILESIL